MADEVATGNTVLDPAFETPPGAPQAPKVPGLLVKLDWKDGCHEAHFVEGPMKGPEVYRCSPRDLTDDKWAAVLRDGVQLEACLEDAPFEQRMAACLHLLEKHCASLLAAAPSGSAASDADTAVSYTHLRAHET